MYSHPKLLLAITAFCLTTIISGNSVAIEKPTYQILHAEGKIEYRLYASYLVAETTVTETNSFGGAASSGFRRLFGYISGDNKSQTSIDMTAPVQQTSSTGEAANEKIAMTAPVQQSKADSGWTVSFMLPNKFKLDTAPMPSSEDISLRQIPSRLMAVIRYSGRSTEKNFDKHARLLSSSIESQGIEKVSAAESAVYNPPFMPAFMRRNEVMFEVTSHPGE